MARIEVFARTEVGCIRERNEDCFVVSHLRGGEDALGADARVREIDSWGTVIAVCDGMGGVAGGDIASAMAAQALRDTLRGSTPFHDSTHAVSAMLAAMTAANRAIGRSAAETPSRRGMGTTMTAALIYGTEAHIAHIGDSRAYIRRGRALHQVTTDHSVVGQLIASGQLTREQAEHYEHRNVLLQALGVQPVIQPEVVIVRLKAGDVLLLCSDGLTGPVKDAQMLEILLRFEDPMRACRALTEAACAVGGPDNVTVAIARFVGEGLEIPRGPEPVTMHRASHTLQT